MSIHRILKFALLLLLLLFSFRAEAALFTAPDKSFTIDLLAGWKVSSKKGAVLFAQHGKSNLTIISVSKCSKLNCIEEALKKDIAAVKAKKYKIIVNTYTGETVKRTEFSTSDPLLSFNYTGGGTDYTLGYFLADLKAYKVEIKGVSDKEAEFMLSFISPAPHSVGFSGAGGAAEMSDLQIGDISIDEQPIVEEDIFDRVEDEDSSVSSVIRQDSKPKQENKVKVNLKSPGKAGWLIIIVLVYFLIVLCLFAVRTFFPAGQVRTQANPRSPYPVRGTRFYGSPDLFFRFYDNQGANYIATASRWGSIFTGIGFLASVVFFMLKMLIIFVITSGYVKLHPVVINTLLSLCSLFSVFGLLLFAAGLLTSFIFVSKFYFYSDKGSMVFRCVQQGFSFRKEEYAVADNENAVLFRIGRERFRLTRHWTIYKGEEIIAVIEEESLYKALLRKCFGHLCGFLRSDYSIRGRMDSKGSIKYDKNIFVSICCDMDKPEAVDSKILMIACAVISMRDRDKWYPWVN